MKTARTGANKGKTDEYGKVINRLRFIDNLVEEKGRGKEKSPCTPLREKGKGKEGKPGAKNTCLFARESAHVRGALLRRHVNAAVEDALRIFNGTRGGKYSDENLWANFAWTFGFGTLNDLVSQARSEMELHKPPVAPSERPKILQGVLSAHWRARFPNGRPGKSRGAKKGSRS